MNAPSRENLRRQVRARVRERLNGRPSEPAPGRPVDEPAAAEPPRPAAAFAGLAGQFVDFLEPQTEADPVAVLAQVLVAFGNCVGRGPHFRVEADHHYTNLFVALVGPTAQGRKGTSWGYVKKLFAAVEPEWFRGCLMNGLATGEGLIAAVRDPVFNEQGTLVDAGVADKRLLVYEPEFARLLKKTQARESILSAVLRHAFDDGCLRHHTRGDPLRATDAHVSLISHITPPELQQCLAATERTNGFGNRILWHFVRRSKYLPEGGQELDPREWDEFVFRFREAVFFARGVREMGLDDAARPRWHAEYPRLSQVAGAAASLLDRGPPITRRLACLYALLNHHDVVQLAHLEAALALWQHAAASVRFIFGAGLDNRLANEIFRGLQDNPQGMSRTQINSFLGRNRRTEEITEALEYLRAAGLASRQKRYAADGRLTVEVWFCPGSSSPTPDATNSRIHGG